MLGFVNKLFSSVQLIVFLDHVLLLAELAQKFKFLQNSCMAKWFHETELQEIYLHIKTRTLLQNLHQPYCFLCRITYFIFQQITVRFFQIDFSSKVLLEKIQTSVSRHDGGNPNACCQKCTKLMIRNPIDINKVPEREKKIRLEVDQKKPRVIRIMIWKFASQLGLKAIRL